MNQAIWKFFKPYAWIVSVFLFAFLYVETTGGILANSSKVMNQPVIRVRIYNYAHVRKMDLRDAERHAAYLFASVGIRIAWMVHSQEQRGGRPQTESSVADFFVRIVPAFMAGGYRHDSGTLGQSLVPSGVHGPTPGGFANIFWDSVKDRSSKSGSTCSEVLGDAMAHELGHLLMGSGHSAWGIMRAHWTLQDLKPDSRARLRFLPADATLLRHAAQLLQHKSMPAVFARR